MTRDYYEKHREKHIASVRRWQKANPEKVVEYHRRYWHSLKKERQKRLTPCER